MELTERYLSQKKSSACGTDMKRIFFSLLVITLLGCDKEFEPELTGWKAYTHPSRRIIFELDGREKNVVLPGDEKISYRFAQWTRFQNHILLTQITRTAQCDDYRIIAIDTTGTIVDTIYTAPSNSPLNFKLAPNDSLFLFKTYFDNCEDRGDYKYTFYNRYSKTALPDTIRVGNARGILLGETVWSPDSKRVILSEWSGRNTKAFVYNLVTKSQTDIDKGSNFKWSPIDTNLVAYIKEYSVYSKNLETGDTDIIFKGKKKKSISDFRWSPNGDFMMLHVSGYLLNLDVAPLQSHNIQYLSLPDGMESRTYFDDQHIDTWKIPVRN
jgi:hypothetical protein